MKKSLLCLSIGLLVAGGVQAQTYYVNETFNSVSAPSLPSGWASSTSGEWVTGVPDNVITIASAAGVTFNSTSHMDAVAINGNNASADGAVLELPTFNIPSSASDATIVYDISYYQFQLNSDPNAKESMALVVSTDGGSTWTNVQTIDPNSNSVWETHTVNIGSYAGQNNLIFGFEYGNTGAALVGVALDNIIALVPGSNDIALMSVSPQQGASNSYGAVGNSINITGTVMNMGTSPISSYTIYYQEGNNTPVSTAQTGNIASFGTGSFNNVTFTIPSTGDFPIKVWATLSGDSYNDNDSGIATITGVTTIPTKRVVFEEATGTWCGWCPRGAVGMDELSAQFPDSTTQIAVHDYDPMMNQAYDSYIGSFIGGYPSIVVDRKYVGDPGDILSQYNQFKSDFGYAEIEIGTPTVSGTSASVPVTITPAVDIANAKLALVVTESNVRHTDAATPPSSSDTAWMQHNYYSPNMNGGPNQGGNVQLPLTGFDDASEYVDGMYYHFVARGAFPSPAGDNVSGIPTNMTAGTDYTATLTGTLDASWDEQNLQYVVLLIADDGSIMNSAATETPTLLPILKDTVGANESISNTQLGINHMELFPNPATGSFATLSCNLATNTTLTIHVVDVTGKVVYSKNSQLKIGDNRIQIPTGNLSNGTYFVTTSSEKGSATIKFVVNK